MKARLWPPIICLTGLLIIAGGRAADATIVANTAVERMEHLTFRGQTTLVPLTAVRGGPLRAAQLPATLLLHRGLENHPRIRHQPAAFNRPTIALAMAPNWPVVPAGTGFSAFAGLTDVDQFNAGTGAYTNTQLEVEPPDVTLCSGNGVVVEAVNNAVRVYSGTGTPLSAPTALSQFFKVAPEFSLALGFGPFVSNPKCYFDRDMQRWFLIALEIDTDPTYGDMFFSKRSSLLLAVSRSADPTAGFGVYEFATTDTSGGSYCPCFDDEPALAADANGLYVSADKRAISISDPDPDRHLLYGAQIYALPKAALANGTARGLVHIDTSALKGFYRWSSVQPANAPDTSNAVQTRGGTQYFVSALDFDGSNDDRIAVWALTNTQSLRSANPKLGLQYTVISSEAYGLPPAAVQKNGPAPLADAFRLPLETLDTGTDRITNTVFAGGRLWSALTTGLRSSKGVESGIAYFIIVPTLSSTGTLAAQIVQQGYIAVADQNIMYPSIGVNTAGGAVLAATLSGPDYFPSAVYVTPDGEVHIAAPSAAPADGFSAYLQEFGYGDAGYYPEEAASVGRWGTYSSAFADADGGIWTAAETIALHRTSWANWGTVIGHLTYRH